VILDTKITIRPAGYCYTPQLSEECVVGISPISDENKHYRLGTVFLRNFYIALDYENNWMGFAQNVDMWDHTTDFDGENSGNPTKPSDSTSTVILIFIILILVVVAYWLFYWKRMQKRN